MKLYMQVDETSTGQFIVPDKESLNVFQNIIMLLNSSKDFSFMVYDSSEMNAIGGVYYVINDYLIRNFNIVEMCKSAGIDVVAIECEDDQCDDFYDTIFKYGE